MLYLVLGAKIFQALEEGNEIDQRQSVVRMKADFMRNRSNLTQEDVEVFVQVRDEDLVIF